MNIFILHKNPVFAAQMLCDVHTFAMAKESAQMLCTAHRVLDEIVPDNFYAKTHVEHPCTKWVMESSANYDWLYIHFKNQCIEYTKRYGKVHLSETKFIDSLVMCPKNIRRGPLTPFTAAMNEEFISDNIVESYRKFYMSKQHSFKKKSMTWKLGNKPDWFIFDK